MILREMQEDRPDTFGHQEIYEGQYVCVMREGHPLGEAPVSLDDYCAARHLLVSYSGRAVRVSWTRRWPRASARGASC